MFKTFDDLLENMNLHPCTNCNKYSPVGKTYHIDNDEIYGIYWFYETDSFIIDIHDFYIKKEIVMEHFFDMSPLIAFVSSYLKSANGEWLTPYQNMTSGTMFTMNANTSTVRFIFHGNFPFCSVGIKFKYKMIEDCILNTLDLDETDIANIFLETRKLVIKPIEKLTNSILNCTMVSPAAELFFEAKAKEWLSITINEYFRKKNLTFLSKSDEVAIENVANYISDHYVLDISQEFLEKIAMMSGTKLKNSFKQKYQMSITEFTQRKRMNIAEALLLTTDLEIKEVAKSIGYTSHSHFSKLFKKYNGIYPREVKKLYLEKKGLFNISCVENLYK